VEVDDKTAAEKVSHGFRNRKLASLSRAVQSATPRDEKATQKRHPPPPSGTSTPAVHHPVISEQRDTATKRSRIDDCCMTETEANPSDILGFLEESGLETTILEPDLCCHQPNKKGEDLGNIEPLQVLPVAQTLA
jgi:hypothetical protein